MARDLELQRGVGRLWSYRDPHHGSLVPLRTKHALEIEDGETVGVDVSEGEQEAAAGWGVAEAGRAGWLAAAVAAA